MRRERVLSEYLAELGRKGGKAASAKLTKQQLIERARMAGLARQAKARKKRKGRSTK